MLATPEMSIMTDTVAVRRDLRSFISFSCENTENEAAPRIFCSLCSMNNYRNIQVPYLSFFFFLVTFQNAVG